MTDTDRQELQNVIKKAIADLRHPWRKMRDNAIDWFMCSSQGEESFLGICTALRVAGPNQSFG
ncbi:hypothetical protein ACQZV8_19650 [Magnetococcales bacterium HHB-1]